MKVVIVCARDYHHAHEWVRQSRYNPKAVFVAEGHNLDNIRGMKDPHVVVLDGFWQRPDAERIAEEVMLTQQLHYDTTAHKFGFRTHRTH